MKASVRSIILLLAGYVTVVGCYYDKEETLYGAAVNCSSVNYTYTNNVSQLITAYCATSGCHDASNAGNVTLNSYSQVVEQSSRVNQRAVVDRTMPPGVKLTAEQIGIIKCWIANGTPQ